MKKMYRVLQAAFVSLFLMSVLSCSGIIGYGVLLWNVPEYELEDGTVVPVYVKSNVSKVYVIGVPGSGEKIEVPLWKLSDPKSRSKANALALKFSEYKGTYAKCVLDGLPVRQDKLNVSKQVYRLRKDEIIKPLYDGVGEAPTNGKQALPGKWIHVITNDGTEGWCFSYNLRTFSMNPDGTYGMGTEKSSVAEKDELLEKILASKWYPLYYREMITKKQIDLEYFTKDYEFDTGFSSGNVKVSLPNLSVSFPYSTPVKRDDKEYEYEENSVRIVVRKDSYIIVKCPDEKGMMKSYDFVDLGEDFNVETAISDVISERQKILRDISLFGPDFTSGNYGTLTFDESGNFTWTGYGSLESGVIPEGAKGNGTVSVKYFLPKKLSSAWDNILTFNFEGAGREVNFFYKKEANGIRFSVAHVISRDNEKNGRKDTDVSQPANSMVLFFQK